MSGGSPHLGYPEGTVLLETKLRYGKLSFKESDLVTRYNTWDPPNEIVESLRQEHASVAEAQVKIEFRQNAIVKKVDVPSQSWCTVL